MAEVIIIQRSIVSIPNQYTVELSEDLKQKVKDKIKGPEEIYKLNYHYNAWRLDDHYILHEQRADGNGSANFGVSHTVKEANERLEARANSYARKLQANLLEKLDFQPPVQIRFHPYVGWDKDNPRLITII